MIPWAARSHKLCTFRSSMKFYVINASCFREKDRIINITLINRFLNLRIRYFSSSAVASNFFWLLRLSSKEAHPVLNIFLHTDTLNDCNSQTNIITEFGPKIIFHFFFFFFFASVLEKPVSSKRENLFVKTRRTIKSWSTHLRSWYRFMHRQLHQLGCILHIACFIIRFQSY